MDELSGGAGNPKQNAWDLFTATGGIGYYLLYKELSGAHDNISDKRR